MHARQINLGVAAPPAFSLLLLLNFALIITLHAQLGDRAGDSQRPPSADIEIPPAPVLSPAEALRSFSLPPGFRIELVAAEPLVHDPVMMAFDARGRLWVAELAAYNISEITTKLPVYLDSKQPVPKRPVGRVVVLEDTDGDGQMDRRTVYWDNIDVPRAIGFIGDQVLIGDPPNLWLTRDKNGDGVMHEKTLLDDKFGTPENVEASPNGLLWGHDNWLYNASYNWRWRKSAAGEWRREPVPSVGQWGLTQDDFGRRFYSTNSDQLRGDLLPSHFAGGLDVRLPFYGLKSQVATDQTTWPVRPTTGVNRGYTKDGNGREQLREDGRLQSFTAASAPVIYRGSNFPASFDGNAFVPEPAGNLVKRNLLLEADGRITAMNAYLGSEFLSSTDERFRPVFLTNGPDGALYVVDYYRGMLEGYEFITTFLRDQIMQRGLNKPLWGLGRIYRVVREDRPKAALPDFAAADPAALVKLLTHENGWTRDTAHRRIVDSGSAAHVPALRDLLSHAPKARDRVSALWCLEGLGSFTNSDAGHALTDADSHVRAAALQAAAPLLRDPAGANLLQLLKTRIASEEPMVLAHLALGLAGTSDAAARELLWSLLPRAPEHPALADSVLIALRGQEVEVLQRLQARVIAEHGLSFGAQGLLESLAVHLTLKGGAAADALVAAITDKNLPQLCRVALMRGAIKTRDITLPEKALAQLAAASPDGWVRRRAADAAATLAQDRINRANRPPVQPLTAAQQAMFNEGRTTFGLCAACHQPNGLGRSDLAPSLKNGRWANAISPDAAIRIVLNGKLGTPGFAAPMAPLGGLTDAQVASVLTFVRRSFGNDAPAVDPGTVERVRKEVSSRSNPWTDAELANLKK